MILFRIRAWNQANAITHGSPTGIDITKDKIEFLFIQRRDSISYIEMMRGKYKLADYEYIRQHLSGMTEVEREKLLRQPFDHLWEELWGPPQEGTHAYRHERDQARQKLEALRAGTPSLEDMMQHAGAPWDTPEWGFPKGRRDMHETEFACAMREMWEETNIRERDVLVIRSMEPLEEEFRGSNDIVYLHKYYVTYVPEGKDTKSFLESHRENLHIQREIGDIRWCSLEEGMQLIRPENTEKRAVLLRADQLLHQYCPVLLGAAGGGGERSPRGPQGIAAAPPF